MGVVRKKPSSGALDTVIFVRHQRSCFAAVSIHLIATYVSFFVLYMELTLAKNRKEKSLRQVAMVTKFLDDTNR